jgi:hypothetical protein
MGHEPRPIDQQSAMETVVPAPEAPKRYFQQYKLAVEMADRISARRLTANTVFLTVNTVLAAVLGAHSFQWYAPIAGMVLSIAWWLLLKSIET